MGEISSNDKEILALAKTNFKSNQQQLKKWNKSKPKDLDQRFHTAHQKEFAKRDCLQCANCCKTTSPIFRQPDIRRMAKALRMKESQLVAQYLKRDEDDDYVLQSSPCFNLLQDNTCAVYEDRPLACREYPHTDRKNMYQIMDLTAQNTLICPAVASIVEKIVNG
ncbi:MAG: YkgJ family cysteine cluster protein [Flavobacteriia bacterium]|jgi:Fe-S-cluster containining protein|nr:YkgJ family cysteine cluster protein [Cryomorphaceae bacterium]